MRHLYVLTAAVLLLLTPLPALYANALPVPSPSHLPRWRGFNLLEKFSKDWSNHPFIEQDFKDIAEQGFNFVRLPMDYRVWIKNGDWTQFDEAVLKEIDKAVAWGQKYGVHVCINFHRAPGYCVNPPKEERDLWHDPEAQRVCALHWATFAKRYKDVPSSQLSFNLFNEPTGVDNATYVKVAGIMVKAIHAVDPQRLIIADGNDGGGTPVPQMKNLGIASSCRGYQPFALTHYKAKWVPGSDQWPLPQWKPLPRLNAYLYGEAKPDLHSPIKLYCPSYWPGNTLVRLHVNTVSDFGHLVVKADGVEVFSQAFHNSAGDGPWKKAVFNQTWGIYQNVYDKDYEFRFPHASRLLEISNGRGDWLTLDRIEIVRGDRSEPIVLLPSDYSWGQKQGELGINADGSFMPNKTSFVHTPEQLWHDYVAPWKKLEAKGVGVMVGEWGAFNQTPHAVVLAWMKDNLKNWKKAGWGWALWNYRGPFGPLDSGRADVKYEPYHGHLLDTEMMDLLKKY